MTFHTLTQSALKEKLHYNPDTGIFTWIVQRYRIKAGSIAGTNKCGYRSISFNHKIYQAHRLAWLYMYGKWPDKFIDHINGNPLDNRICNLREATISQNAQNQKPNTKNTSGYKGVLWHKRDQKWQARAMIKGKQYHLGQFDSPEEASVVYQAFAKENFGDFYRA